MFTANPPISLPKKVKSKLGNLFLVLFSVTFFLLLLEGLARIFYYPVQKEINHFRLSSSLYYQQDQLLGWVPRNNVTGIHKQPMSFDTRFTTNSRGLRDKEYSIVKPPNVIRIVVLGDSFTWGFGVNDNAIYTEILESMYENVEVINLGVYKLPLDEKMGITELCSQ